MHTNTLAVVSLAIVLSACGSTSTIPTSPTPTATATPVGAAPAATYTLFGVVYEVNATGRSPIEGVEVYCDSCGSPDGHTFVYTDANGLYRLEWAAGGVHPLFVRKDGYRHPNGAPLDDHGRIRATVNGDTRFDVELVRR